MFKRIFLLVLFTSGLVWAQVADAMISGRVYDERGLPLPNVKMTMRNLETGRTWSEIIASALSSLRDENLCIIRARKSPLFDTILG